MMRKDMIKRTFNIVVTVLLLCCMLLVAGCDSSKSSDKDKQTEKTTEKVSEAATEAETETTSDVSTMSFVDVFGVSHDMTIDVNAPKCPYNPENFVRDGEFVRYEDDNYTSLLGIDISEYQGSDINWEALKNQGLSFVILRAGYRGYGEAGTLNSDNCFEANYANAMAYGFDVGVYYFSQATNEAEAVEEANYVLGILGGRPLNLPIVFDLEHILNGEDARTDGISGEQFTRNAIAFCEQVNAAGYDAMVYSNMMWEAFEYDMTTLSAYPIWYADYEALPQSPYDFEFWQYSQTGRVDGINGNVDLDLRIVAK